MRIVRRVLRLARRALPWLALALVAMVAALAVTPPVTVSAYGQTVDVGAVKPSLDLGLAGPGQADLFGEGTVDTVQQFDGPVRPRIVWQRFNRDDRAGEFIQSTAAGGRRVVRTNVSAVGAALRRGWTAYFIRLVVVAGLTGGVLYLVVLGLDSALPGRRRRAARAERGHRLAHLAVAVLVSGTLTAAFTALTVASAATQLASVSTLSDLVGTVRLAPVPVPAGPSRADASMVVLGDSTAAGIGNSAVPEPTPQDTACRRSADAYAMVLGRTSGQQVLNLACSSATIARGLLGPQQAGADALAPQVGLLQSVTSVRTVFVSIGANDVGWSDSVVYCYALPRCDDRASDQLFQSRLDAFKIQYIQLLQQLGDLPSHPAVVVNLYYDPFGDRFDCSALRDRASLKAAPPGYGFAPDRGQDPREKIRTKIDPLRSQLSRLDGVLAEGAKAFGFTAVQPRFDGHDLCSDQPWVQGVNGRAPFHPTAAGELAIALADLPYVDAGPS